MSAEISAKLARQAIDNLNEGRSSADIQHPDGTSWHNTDHTDVAFSARGDIVAGIRRAVPDFRFDDVEIHAWDGGYAVQYVVRGSLPDGSEIHAPACVIGTVRDGKIFRSQEYLDSAHVAGLRAAFAAKAAAAADS